MALVIAIGVTDIIEREILRFDVGTSEDGAFRSDFPHSLKARGLRGARLVVSDRHAGLCQAISEVLTGATCQHSEVHAIRNVLSQVPKKGAANGFLDHSDYFHPDHARSGPRAAWPSGRGTSGAFPEGDGHFGGSRGGCAGVYGASGRTLATDLLDQPARAAQSRDASADGRRADFPGSSIGFPPRWSYFARAARRMAGVAAIFQPGVMAKLKPNRPFLATEAMLQK